MLLASRTFNTDVKIADFCFARYAPDDGLLQIMCSTPGYVVPEILQREGYGMKCNLWSMSMIVFILVGGYPPIYGRTPRKIFQLTLAGRFAFDLEYWSGISLSCKDAICAILELDPARCASAGEIPSHP
jgi:serine/threonine protein kinase